jgi:hypothetical protein
MSPHVAFCFSMATSCLSACNAALVVAATFPFGRSVFELVQVIRATGNSEVIPLAWLPDLLKSTWFR